MKKNLIARKKQNNFTRSLSGWNVDESQGKIPKDSNLVNQTTSIEKFLNIQFLPKSYEISTNQRRHVGIWMKECMIAH